jgi:2,4-dienoyl-CoA reductase (NADPH2)
VQPSVPEGAFIYLAESVKKVVESPVIGGTRLRHLAIAEEILSQGKVDMVYMGRALLADLHLPAKAMKGETQTIRPCIVCNSCLGKAVYGQPISCTVNPALAEKPPPRAKKSSKVLVIGGGPAGMQAAITAANRGHQVQLWEKENKLGGNLIPASIPPYKRHLEDLRVYLSQEAKKAGVRIECNKEASLAKVQAFSPQVVILATGATPAIQDIPGVKGDNVITAVEVLLGEKDVGGEVVIVGGGLIGCETAEFLLPKAKKITVLEMLDRLATDYERVNRWVLVQRLRRSGVRTETKAKVIEITDQGVKASRDGQMEFIPARTVILATGLKPNEELLGQLKGDFALHPIGDCLKVDKIAHALKSAFLLAKEIWQRKYKDFVCFMSTRALGSLPTFWYLSLRIHGSIPMRNAFILVLSLHCKKMRRSLQK